MTNGYQSPHWFTFRQAKELGGNVRKGERGELVLYADRIIRTDRDDKGEESERAIPFLKGSTSSAKICPRNTPISPTRRRYQSRNASH